jgi:cytochrome b561
MRMNATPDGPRWSAMARFLHWLVAVLIFTQFALGWLAATWRLSPAKLDLFVWHKSNGMLILVLVALRLVWRLIAPAPPLPAATPTWERAAAHASHALLYLVMLGMPLSGWIINSAAAIPFKIFWRIPLPAIVAADPRGAAVASRVHFSLGLLLAALLVVHIAAALWHHFIQRDNVLIRMLPARRLSK